MTEYKTAEDVIRAADLAIEDTAKEQPNINEDDIAHDIYQSYMMECDEAMGREVARRTGVAYPGSIRLDTDLEEWFA